MKDDGILKDYDAYMLELKKYNEQLQAEEETKYKAYEQALLTTPNLSYEDFLKSYHSVISVIQEPQIPQTVKDFIKKYL